MLDMYKKSTGADRDKLRPKVEKAAQQVGIKLQLKEAPEGMFYLKVDIRDARQAIGILDDKYKNNGEFLRTFFLKKERILKIISWKY